MYNVGNMWALPFLARSQTYFTVHIKRKYQYKTVKTTTIYNVTFKMSQVNWRSVSSSSSSSSYFLSPYNEQKYNKAKILSKHRNGLAEKRTAHQAGRPYQHDSSEQYTTVRTSYQLSVITKGQVCTKQPSRLRPQCGPISHPPKKPELVWFYISNLTTLWESAKLLYKSH